MATKKRTVKQFLKSLSAEKRSGTVKQIVAAYKHGYSKLDIIQAGFNKNTVYRQTREHDMQSA
jgi:hypothetical protein